MKNLSLFASIFAGILFITSCSKTMSTDLPLPVERQESVYIATENNKILSYDAATGNKNWEININGYSAGVPLLYNKKLYVITNFGYLYSIDILRGEIYNEKNTGYSCTKSLAAADGRVFVASNKMYAFDTTLSEIWNFDPGISCTTSPTVKNDNVYFCADKKCYSVTASGGNSNWSSTFPSTLNSSPSVSNGVVYFGCDDNVLYALNESDGTQKWTYITSDNIYSSPAVYGGMSLVGSDDFGIYCVDTTSGKLRWQYQTAERVKSSPTIHEFTNSVLIGSYDFNLYSIDFVTGKLNWKYPTGGLVKSSPVVYENYIYFTSFDRYLYCVDARDGRTVWKSFLNANAASSPMVDNLSKGVHAGISGMSPY